jgi:hypothetical protein
MEMMGRLFITLVGTVFLLTGALKVTNLQPFLRQVDQYGLVRRSAVRWVGLSFAALECAIGAGLILHVSGFLIPAVMALLLVLSGLTYWGTSSGRVEDCGCYGGLFMLSPGQSIALNLGYIGLLSVAWFDMAPIVETSLLKWAAVIVAFAAASALAWRSLAKPIFEISPLRKDKRWSSRWLTDSPRDLRQGSHFVVFLSRTCPFCKQWVPLLNVIEVESDLPQVLGVVSLAGVEREQFLSEHLIHFPVTHMHQSLMSLLIGSFPTAALVENGVITAKWEGEMPQVYLDRVRRFFRTISDQEVPRARTFSG